MNSEQINKVFCVSISIIQSSSSTIWLGHRHALGRFREEVVRARIMITDAFQTDGALVGSSKIRTIYDAIPKRLFIITLKNALILL